MARHYQTNGAAKEVHPKGKTFTMKELQEYVGGYFTPVRLDGNNVMLCCEDAMPRGLEPNRKATEIAAEHRLLHLFGGAVLGDVLIVNNNEWD